MAASGAADVVTGFLCKVVTEVVNPLILLLSAGAFIVFLWGILVYIRASGEPEKRRVGGSGILWGFVGLVIIFGAYGLINLATGTFGLPLVTKVCGS